MLEVTIFCLQKLVRFCISSLSEPSTEHAYLQFLQLFPLQNDDLVYASLYEHCQYYQKLQFFQFSIYFLLNLML